MRILIVIFCWPLQKGHETSASALSQVKEALRLYPSVPFFDRLVTQPLQLGNLFHEIAACRLNTREAVRWSTAWHVTKAEQLLINIQVAIKYLPAATFAYSRTPCITIRASIRIRVCSIRTGPPRSRASGAIRALTFRSVLDIAIASDNATLRRR
jgi:hypothetical protein